MMASRFRCFDHINAAHCPFLHLSFPFPFYIIYKDTHKFSKRLNIIKNNLPWDDRKCKSVCMAKEKIARVK